MILKTPKLTKVSGDEKVYFCGCPLIGAGVQNKREGGKEGGSEPGRNWVGYSEMISLIRNGPYCDISEPLG